MKILHLRSSNFYGGPERQIHFHCLKARESEFNIIVGTFSLDNTIPDFLQVMANDKVMTQTFKIDSNFDTGAITLIRDYLTENKIDILCTHEYRTHLIGWLASQRTTTKWIAFSRGWTSENILMKARHTIDKIVIRFADHIIAVSHSQKTQLKKILVPSAKITVAHNATDLSAFRNIEKVNLRRRFGLADNSIIGIAGGRFSPEKGQLELIRAAQIAINVNRNLFFILFGDGPEIDIIRKKIAKYNLDKNIICPGFEKNLIGCLKGADYLVNPSLSEGLPNIILEAMAIRVPCVATEVGGVGEIIENYYNGLLSPSKSPEKLAKAILEISDDKTLVSNLTSNAYKTIIDNFSFESQFDKIKTVYLNVVNN